MLWLSRLKSVFSLMPYSISPGVLFPLVVFFITLPCNASGPIGCRDTEKLYVDISLALIKAKAIVYML